MNFSERQAATWIFRNRLAELHGNEFEDFFYNLMAESDAAFVDVRTAGRLGDMGADGICLVGRKVYACYGPSTFDHSNAIAKMNSDLAKAIEKRDGQFDEFCFVHNDIRGLHPLVTIELATMSDAHPKITFSAIGGRHLKSTLLHLDRISAETVLKDELLVEALVYGVGADDLASLLDHLHRSEKLPRSDFSLGPISKQKMAHNRIKADARRTLVDGLHLAPLVHQYFEGLANPMERAEVARSFKSEYEEIRAECDDPEEILWQLECYILGNKSCLPRERRAAQGIIAHFFETCEVFDEPPSSWDSPADAVIPS